MSGSRQQRCGHCLRELEPRLGYRARSGEALCGPCYFALWDPRGAELHPRSEAARPASRRRRGKTVWVRPTGELDPRERRFWRLRRLRRRHRRR